MRLGAVVAGVATVALITGCFPVILSDEPLGSEGAVLDAAQLNGTWLYRGWQYSWVEGSKGLVEGLVQVRVLDAQAGALVVEEPCQPPSAESDGKSVVLRWRRSPSSKVCAGCAFYFAQWVGENNAGEKQPFGALFTVLSDAKSVAFLYVVDSEVDSRLLRLVSEGALPGRFDFRSPEWPVVLGPLSPQHYEVILSVESGLFDWRTPVALLKLPDELNPCKKPVHPQ